MENTYFSLGIHGKNDPIPIKEKAFDFMRKILNCDNFGTIIEGKRGTYSIRNTATEISRRFGCSKDETDTRSRMKQRRQKYLYADMILLCPYAKVSATLCKEGPINNQVRAYSVI